MGFDVNLTMTGLCLLVMDPATISKSAELLILDTSGMTGDHRHYPYMSFLYDNRGNLGNIHQPSLPGWEEFVIGPDGRAITRVSLDNTIVRIRTTADAGTVPTTTFVRDPSIAKVPDLRLLGVTSVSQPGQDDRIANITSRLSLPAGTLFTTGDVTDNQGPIQWLGVGVIAEFVHLKLQGLSDLRVDHGGNSFSLKPVDGVVDLSISNEPTTVPGPSVDSARNLVLVPHFDMFGQVASPRPELARQGHVTPGNPACPTGSWIQANWPFLT